MLEKLDTVMSTVVRDEVEVWHTHSLPSLRLSRSSTFSSSSLSLMFIIQKEMREGPKEGEEEKWIDFFAEAYKNKNNYHSFLKVRTYRKAEVSTCACLRM